MKKKLFTLIFLSAILLINLDTYAVIKKNQVSKNIVVDEVGPYEAALLERMKPIEDEYEPSSVDGSTLDMRESTAILFNAWDKELNIVYKLLLKKCSEKEKENLRKVQRAWIKTKEKEATKLSEEFKGGSWEGLFYLRGELDSTKRRTLELAKLYDEKSLKK